MAAARNGGGTLTLLGLLAGAAIGAAVGLVYSPSTGEENRKRLAQWIAGRTTDLREKAQAQAQEIGNKAKDSLPGGQGRPTTGNGEDQC